MSPTARTLDRLRKFGYLAGVVERRNPHTRQLNDLYGFVDVLAVNGETLAVQATTMANRSSRVLKVTSSPNLSAVLAAGWRVEVWGWSKRKLKRGGKAVRWSVSRVEMIEDSSGVHGVERTD